MKKNACLIFALGTIGIIAILSKVQIPTLCKFQCAQIILTCVGMECCSLLPLIIETENKDYTYNPWLWQTEESEEWRGVQSPRS